MRDKLSSENLKEIKRLLKINGENKAKKERLENTLFRTKRFTQNKCAVKISKTPGFAKKNVGSEER